MDEILNNLSSALLITLIVMIAFILYKRLIKSFKTPTADELYATIKGIDRTSTRLEIEYELLKEESVKLMIVFSGSENLIFEGNLEQGIHSSSYYLDKIEEGKYEIRLITNNQSTSRYFQI